MAENIGEVTSSFVAALQHLAVAALADVLGPEFVMASDILPIVAGSRLVGPAATCFCPPGDNLPLHRALNVAPPGCVLVIGSHNRAGNGLWGGLATRSASARGIAVVSADGGVRDVSDIRDFTFPVWARFVSPLAAGKKATEGCVGVPVSCGGVVVSPGDVIVADSDGIIVVPLNDAGEVVRAATLVVERERLASPQLERGALPSEVLGATWPR